MDETTDKPANGEPTGQAAPTRHEAGGLPLEAGLRALSEEIPRGATSRALADISDRLARGESLQRVLDDPRQPAPLLLRELLRCGLNAGKLAEVLAAWLTVTRRAGDVRRKIIGGLAYPAVLVGFMFAIFGLLLIWIVPEMGRLLGGFNVNLPSMTVLIIGLSSGLRSYGLWILLGLIATVTLAAFWPRIVGRPLLYRRMLRAVPVIGTAGRFAALATFCRLLAELVRHGVPLPAAIRAAGNGTSDPILELHCTELAERMERGVPLDEAARTIPEFPPQVVYMFRSAGSPDAFVDVLRGTAEMYDAQARVRAGLVPLIAEPVVIVGIAVTFVTLVISLFLPLIKMITSLT